MVAARFTLEELKRQDRLGLSGNPAGQGLTCTGIVVPLIHVLDELYMRWRRRGSTSHGNQLVEAWDVTVAR